MKIKYYLNFKEENRVSMDEFGQQLIDYQTKNYEEHEISYFKPNISLFSKLIFIEKFRMRHARYFSYPKQIKKLPFHDISHICDQQYGHLYSSLNSKVKIITVNDLVPIVLKKQIGRNPILIKYSLSKLKYYDKVIAISETTKGDILKYTDCPEKKIEVLLRVSDPYFDNKSINENEICELYNLPKDKIKILIEGNIFYKNNETAFNTLRELLKKNNNIIFVKIGGKSDLSKFNDLKDKIYDLPFIKKKNLSNIYKICRIFFAPTIYTGGSLPILESMKCGTPVVCSNTGSLMEIVKDTALTCNATDIKSFVKNILSLLEDNKLFLKLKNDALERSKIFDLSSYHNKLIDIYKKELSYKNEY